jgi:multicomponent Na+:H+ antiporter subunit A
MWFGPLTLGTLGFLFGLMPKTFLQSFLNFSASAVYGGEVFKLVKAFPGLNWLFFLSFAALIFGFFLATQFHRFEALGKFFSILASLWPERIYEKFIFSVPKFSLVVTNFFQPGKLHSYVSTLSLFLVLCLGYLFYTSLVHQGLGLLPMAGLSRMPSSIDWILSSLVVGACGSVLLSRSYIHSLLSVGVIGFAVAGFYAYYSAPDLAITQILVETIGIVLTVFLLLAIPAKKGRSPFQFKPAVLSLSLGLMVGLLSLQFLDSPGQKISYFFKDYAYELAQGKNIVNVILVDFRGLDTMGEVLVVLVAGVGVVALFMSRDWGLLSQKKQIEGEGGAVSSDCRKGGLG